MNRDCEAPSAARISVTVTEFQEIGNGRGCSRADIELTDTGHGKVSQGRINDPIVVSAEVYLDFFVSARQGDRYAYMPVGIGFRETTETHVPDESGDRRSEGDGRDPLGRSAFPVRTIASKGDTTQLTLFDANPQPGKFEFSLVIQRSDGRLSVVDPQIHNNPIMK